MLFGNQMTWIKGVCFCIPTAHRPSVVQAGSICMKSLLNLRKVEIEGSFIGHTYINPNTHLSSLKLV